MDEKKPNPWSNLVEILRYRAETSPDSMAYTFLKDGVEEEEIYTYSKLDRHARAIAASLGEVKGSRALLLYPPGVGFVAGFFGTLYAGAIPIPAPPPDLARLKRTLPRLQSIILDAEASLMVTTGKIADSLLEVIDESVELTQLRMLATDDVDLKKADEWQGPPETDEDDIAYLQYTSGSTSAPKGVMITHKNIIVNSEVIRQGFGYNSKSVEVTWMPYFHDYGLVDGLIQPLYHGIPCYVLSPLTFIRRPERWLEAISRFGGTHTQAPNFAYEQCIRKISEKKLAGIDLSCMITASSGGEPIRSETIQGFMEKFAVCGLKPEAVCPAYGLAETTLLVSAKTKVGPPLFCFVDNEEYKNDKIIEVDPEDPGVDARSVVSCGIVLNGVDVAITDVETEASLPDGSIGEVWVGGESIGAGYWRHPEESEETFRARLSDDPGRGPFLRTGDLGFVLRNNLYITGRKKDLIITAGVNHYPQDIEWTVQEASPEVRTDHCVAFSVDVEGEERLVVVAEAESKSTDWQPVLLAIRKAISENHELDLYALQMIRRGTILKTSSGKLQRRGCRNAFLEDQFESLFTWRRQISAFAKKQAVPDHGIRRDLIEQWLIDQVAEQLSLPAVGIDVNRPLAEYGLTSRAGVAVVGQLESWLGMRDLSSTLLWEYPTIASLSRYLEAGESTEEIEPGKPSVVQEPIAVVGMSCRFPQAGTLEAFWDLLVRETDAITEVPSNRWKAEEFYADESGKSGFINNRHGGFIDDVDQFDAAFFGISPSEAVTMDPQQRLLLELAWEAFESAGMDPFRSAGTDCGVYIGISTNDYSERQIADRFAINPYTGPAKSNSIAANRISYLFDLNGPSMAIDTACSSSLVALHQAKIALQRGDCPAALVGGVNLLLSPKMSIALSQAQMLSADGHCKPFDASANGYVRSEGGGMVLLKRLSEAERDGDRIFAILRGSAINQDGKSNGLTAPNGLAQQKVIQQALADSGVRSSQVSYVEAHGTGTPLGDPIEIRSLQKVLEADRTEEQVCTIGSVKSNIGHLEAAAGMAGFIKVVLSLYHQQIPANSNFEKLNELIHIQGTPFGIADRLRPWADPERIAGVSSFGFGGTNAHAILSSTPLTESAMKAESKHIETSGRYLLPVSARTPGALKQLAVRYYDHLSDESGSEIDIENFCCSAAVTRSSFENRLMVTGGDQKDVADELYRFITGQEGSWSLLETGQEPLKTVWLFTGQGSQYTGMGKLLYETEPVFRNEIDKCNQILEPLLKIGLPDLLWDESHADKLNHTRYTQPALFTLQVSLARLLMKWGMFPDAVIGYSVGELAAACVAGILSLEDGLLLIAERGRLVHEHGGEGGMAAISSDEKTVKRILTSVEGVEIATLNGPAGQVISGSREAVEQAMRLFEAVDIETRMLNVSHAFHSELMDPALKPFAKVAKSITYHLPRIPILSNLTGTFSINEMSDAAYWVDHLRKPVRFGDSMSCLFTEKFDTFIEIGPKPTILGMAGRFEEADGALWLPTLRPGESDRHQLLKTAGILWQRGVNIDWREVYTSTHYERIPLPGYPFERRRYWLDESSVDEIVEFRHQEWDLLGTKIESPLIPATLFQPDFSLDKLPFYSEHRVFGEVVVPAAGQLSLLLEAGKSLYDSPECRFRDLIFPQPLILSGSEKKQAQLVIEAENSEGLRPFRLISFPAGNRPHVEHSEHVSGSLGKPSSSPLPDTVSLKEILRRCDRLETKDFYTSIWQDAILLGERFRWVKSLRYGENEVLMKLEAPAVSGPYTELELFPGLLDSALQGITALVDLEEDQAMVPFSLDDFVYRGRKTTNLENLWSHISITEATGDTAVADVTIRELLEGGEDRLIAEIKGFRVQKVSKAILLKNLNPGYADHLYGIEWEKVSVPKPADETKRWICLVDSDRPSKKMKGLKGFGNRVDVSDPDQLQSELAQGNVAGILFAKGLELHGEPESEGLEQVISTLLDVLQRIDNTPVPLVVLTSGAQSLAAAETCEPLQTGLWGLGRVIQREMPQISCRLLDLDPAGTSVVNLHSLLADEHLFEMISRGAELYQPQLVRTRPDNSSLSSVSGAPFSQDAAYLITGGLGKLGLELAEWLVDQGAGSILLLGRNLPGPEQRERIRVMNTRGSIVSAEQGDVSNESDLKQLFRDISKQNRPLKGIFHLAGVLDDGPLNQQSWPRFEAVLAPKISGSWNLHQLSREMELDHFVIYSSASSVLGTAGQASYAMANAYVDGLIRQRRSEGLPGMAMNWGPWTSGMGSGLSEQFEQKGIELMDPHRALATFGELIQSGSPAQTVLFPVDWSRYAEGTDHNPLFKDLLIESATRNNGDAGSQPNVKLAAMLETAGPAEKWELLELHIRQIIGSFLHIQDPAALSGRKRLFEAGLDSLGAVELKNRIASALGRDQRSTLLFDYPSIDDLVEHLGGKVMGWKHENGVTPAKQDSNGSGSPHFDDLSDQDLADLLAEELGSDTEEKAGDK